MEQCKLDQKMLVFLHIPKTAGNSVFNIIRRQYPASRRYELDMDWHRRQATIDAFAALSDSQKQAIGYVGGHIFYGFHRFIPQPAVYMSFLRDPVDRFISHYYFIKESPFEPLRTLLEKKVDPTHYERQALEFLRLTEHRRGSLDEFLELCIELDVVNLQTRLIGGFVDPANITPPFSKMPENAVQLATDNINRDFPVVGLVERFDESLLLFREAFGWRNVYYAKHNLTRARPELNEIPQTVRDKIAAASALDMELYALMKKRFDEQINGLGDGFARQLAQFQRGTCCYAFLQKAYRTSGLKRIRQMLH